METHLLLCPHCNSQDVRRSRTRWYDVLWIVFGIRPYRCMACGKRLLIRG